MESASTKEMLYKQYICPHLDYCKAITQKYISAGLELDDTFSMVLTHLYENIIYYKPNKPLQTFLHICIKRYVCSLNKSRYKELVTIVRIDNNKKNNHLVTIPSNNHFQTGDFDKLGTLYFSDSLYCSLQLLKPIDREIILLHYVDGYDFQRIAEMKHLTTPCVRSKAFLSLIVMRYKITGKKPPKAPIYKYLEISAYQNAI